MKAMPVWKRNEHAIQNFRNRLADVMLEKSITNVQLAEAAGLSYDAVLKLRRGHRSPTLETMTRMASALNVFVADLLEDPEP